MADAERYMPPAELVEAIRKDIGTYEARRAHAHRQLAWRVPLFMGGFALLIAGALWLRFSSLGHFELGAVDVLVLVGVVFGGIKLHELARLPATETQQGFRDHLLPVIFGFVDDVTYRHGYTPSCFSRLPSEVTGSFNRQSFDDVVTGVHDGTRFELFETHLQEKAGKSTHTRFKGVILHFMLERGFPGMLVVARRPGSVGRFFRGLFENGRLTEITSKVGRLDDIYEFRTDNEAAAQPLVGGRLAEALEWLQQSWPHEPARLALRGNDAFLLLPTSRDNFFELPGISVPLDYRAHVEPIIAEMALLLETASLVHKAVDVEAPPPRQSH